jgi:diguanylate cyclase (GGDEF)-like protein
MTAIDGAARDAATILIVDDSRTIRQILRRVLVGAGYRVTEAADGSQGLAAIRESRPDLVLLDVDMPVLDGLATMRAMRADQELSTIPVLFLTARTSGNEVAEGLELGAQDYLRKPCEPSELLARVATTLLRSRQEEDLRRRTQALDELSTTDPLTSLGNRRRFELRTQALSELGDQDQRIGIIMVDIDHFKAVNDTEGHTVGDTVLTVVASRMSSVIDGRTTLVRWGGEEFVVLLPRAEPETLRLIAERLRSMVAESPLTVAVDHAVPVTISLGCALGPLSQVPSVIQAADSALYAAKARGRNRVEFA